MVSSGVILMSLTVSPSPCHKPTYLMAVTSLVFERRSKRMTVDQQAIQDRVIAEHAHEVHTTEDAIRVSVLVGQAIDEAYNEQPLAHTKRIVRTDQGFTDGACCGYLCYFYDWQGKLLLDRDIFTQLQD